MESAEPFKVGTFAINDIPTVGLVMRDDALVVDLNAANRAMQLLPQYSHLDMPVDMIGLIERYEYGLKYRIYEVVNWLVEEELLSGSAMRDFVHPVANVDIMAPITKFSAGVRSSPFGPMVHGSPLSHASPKATHRPAAHASALPQKDHSRTPHRKEGRC